jgi:hypothetical protein
MYDNPDKLQGKFHDQADAIWIVIRGQLWGQVANPWPAYRLARCWPPLGRILCF